MSNLIQKRTWPRLLLEGTVIVLSILLAFGIDAWWDNRKDSLREKEIIEGLKREFNNYKEIIQGSIRTNENMISAYSAILISIDAGSWKSETWTIDDAIGQLLLPPSIDLGQGVRDALIQGGQLEILSNVLLREKLAQWPNHFLEIEDDELLSRQIVVGKIMPYLINKEIPLSKSFSASNKLQKWPVERKGLYNNQLDLLLNDPVFRSLVEIRYDFWDHAHGEYETALKEIDEILELINQ